MLVISVGGYHQERDKYINQEVNLQDRFGGIALVTYEARGWAKVGDDSGQQRWATTVGDNGGRRQWAMMVGNNGV